MGGLDRSLSFVQLLRAEAYQKRTWLFALLAVVAGIALGTILMTPVGGTAASVIAIAIYFVVIVISPLGGLLLWLVTQPLADEYLNLSLGAGIPDLSPTRFCLVFITILVLARASIGRMKLLPFTKVDLVAVLYLLGMILSAPNGVDGWRSLQNIFDGHVVPVLVYLLAKNLVDDQATLKKVVFSALLLATYVGLYAIYEQLTGNILFVVTENARVDYGDSGLRILRGLLGHPHPFGRILGIAIPFNLYLLLEERRPVRRVLYLLSLSAMFLGLYFTYRRSAWVAVLASLFLIQWFYPRFRRLFIVAVVVALLFLYVNREQLSTSSVGRRVQAGSMSTLHGRTPGWTFALQLWKRQPLTGYGYGQYANIAQREGVRDTAIESQYLSILVSAGLLGFLPYAALLILMPLSLIKSFRSSNSQVSKWMIVMYWAAHLSYVINALTATVGQVVTTSLLFVLAGALTGLQMRGSTAKKETRRGRYGAVRAAHMSARSANAT